MQMHWPQVPGPLPPSSEWAALKAQLTRHGAALALAYRRQPQPEGLTVRQHRPYVPGDDPRALDWAATARLAIPIVREFEDEHNYPVWTVIDTSRAMFWGSAPVRKIDLAARIALAFGRCVLQNGDRWGLACGGRHLERAWRPRPGLASWRDGWNRMAGLHPPDGTGNLPHLLEGVRRLRTGRGLIVVISDFPEGDWHRPLARIVRYSHVVALQLVDPLDKMLPASGLTALVDPETGHSGVYDLSYAQTAAVKRHAENRRKEVAERCRALGITYGMVETDQPWLAPVQQALKERFR